jgi:hypothetical protein
MSTNPRPRPWRRCLIAFGLVIQVLAAGAQPVALQASPLAGGVRRVNVPNLTGVPFAPAIFWLGQVGPSHNYADVRVWYYAPHLRIVMHIIDRRLWADPTPSAAELPQWDAVSIYLSLGGNSGTLPGPAAYRFEIGLSNNYRTAARGDGSGWVAAPITVQSSTTYRGLFGPNSDGDAEGWVADFTIPFSSLGLAGPPAAGTVWGLGVGLHDRDDAGGLAREDTAWPEAMLPTSPGTWGQLAFGAPAFTQPIAVASGTITVRNGLSGATVLDGAVGGHTTCGNDGLNKWAAWGSANHAGRTQMNVQNQWDVSDWPCFSKFYVTFPLPALPAGQALLGAALTLHLFGTAGGGAYGPPPDSYLEVLTVDRDWDEATLTWNNAPLALENISSTWVPPVPEAYDWDVSQAVAQAYSAGAPLRLVVYSIDGEQHSGKYFYTSDSNDWGGQIRPALTIVYGELCSAPGTSCQLTFLPLTLR